MNRRRGDLPSHMTKVWCHAWRVPLVVSAACAFLAAARSSAESPSELPPHSCEVTTFAVDITPPVGRPIGLGFIPTLLTVEHPLMAKGVVLRDTHGSYVLCTLDWMEVHGDSYDLLRESIAVAAQIPPSHVALQCVHQHTAPAISSAAQRLQLDEDDDRRVATQTYLDMTCRKLTRAVRESQEHWQAFTHVGTGQAKVERVASSRRIELPDGRILGRGSNTRDRPELREYPVGVIDPVLRTVSIHANSKPLAQLHYYATHPQSFYGDQRISYDIPGMVREKLERETGVFQVYFTGCGGDIGMGKFNDGSREARRKLSERVYGAIRRSTGDIQLQPANRLLWQTHPVRFPLREDESFSEQPNRRILDNPEKNFRDRLKAAIALAWIERNRTGRPVELSCLAIGSIRILQLPGEPFVQYQLTAQKMQPACFVCVAGYADCAMGYIGPDRIYQDRGGYEQTYAFSGPCEELLLNAIRKTLAR